ncbi:MAG: Phasin protein [Proteobacteria bacterium]|nr:Phasin protein [Pseudomonadota bacterium]
MAEDTGKPTDSAEQAYAAASAAVPAKPEPATPAVAPKVIAAPAKKAAKSVPAPQTPAPKPVVAVAPSAPPKPTLTELKEKIMATAKSTDFSKTITDTVSEMQAKAKAAYEKSTELAGEATEFAKGNVEALVESSKILAAGLQDLGKMPWSPTARRTPKR